MLVVNSALTLRRSKFASVLVGTVSAFALGCANAVSAAQTTPQAATDAASTVEEVVVTGSRIVREGYEAPTPLTVVGTEQLEAKADSNLMNFLQSMPAITGSATNTSSSTALANGAAGLQTLNLRSLGGTRVLVLLDGQRTVGSTTTGTVDVASFPSQLVQRVDVVTGGASAVYGSDAVAGVVNFVLDRNFTGVKGELSGGLTNYGDDKNYKIDLSAGFGFADNRGHVLLSGEHMFNKGIHGDGGRQWNRLGWQQIVNPAYNATTNNSVPQQLFLNHVGVGVMAPGGLITSGPLKGTAFGPGGTPYKFNYGSIFSNPYMQGGDWQLGDLRPYNDIDQKQNNNVLFARLSYDVTDNFNVYAQWGWTQARIYNDIAPSWVFGTSGYVVKVDNAYLPASVRAAMVANGVTQFAIGTTNADSFQQLDNSGVRRTNRLNTGVEGKFNAFNTEWKWNAYFAYGNTGISFGSEASLLKTAYTLATDAVVNPANGQIVCRVALTNPATDCRPWNNIGVGVNNGNLAGWNYINNNGAGSKQHGPIEQTTYAASITGEPFSIWAGPVSLALSFEHRKDEINITADPPSVATGGGHILGNVPALTGKQSVTEGAVETLIPLAKGESWAQAWDLNLAVRFTGYELSGNVTTWKIGTTYTPIDDIKLRFTRSRDIRAPNLSELFLPGSTGSAQPQIIDRFRNNQQYAIGTTLTTGNPNLLPEKADTTGIGAVLQPRFLEGFTASVDYWDVNISGALYPLAVQQVIDLCYNGTNTAVCPNLIRNATTGLIQTIQLYSINLATQDVRGIDLEASYRTPLSSIVDSWRGGLTFHGNMTFYMRNYTNNTFQTPTDKVGENNATNPPNWKLTATIAYNLDPVTVTLTGRAIPAGKIDATFIECTSGCPAATTDHPTININRIPGAFYLDANVTYKFDLGNAKSEFFIAAKNLFNKDPPPLVTSYFANAAATGSLYDPLGTVYRVGLRFKM